MQSLDLTQQTAKPAFVKSLSNTSFHVARDTITLATNTRSKNLWTKISAIKIKYQAFPSHWKTSRYLENLSSSTLVAHIVDADNKQLLRCSWRDVKSCVQEESKDIFIKKKMLILINIHRNAYSARYFYEEKLLGVVKHIKSCDTPTPLEQVIHRLYRTKSYNHISYNLRWPMKQTF